MLLASVAGVQGLAFLCVAGAGYMAGLYAPAWLALRYLQVVEKRHGKATRAEFFKRFAENTPGNQPLSPAEIAITTGPTEGPRGTSGC